MSNYKAYLKNWLKKRPRAYCVVRAVRGTDSEFEKIINAYFQTKKPILVVDNNLAEESELYYMIYRGVKDKYYSGFFAMVRETMRFLAFSETLPLTPVVYWEKMFSIMMRAWIPKQKMYLSTTLNRCLYHMHNGKCAIEIIWWQTDAIQSV